MGRQENLLKSLELLRDLSLKSDSLRTIKHLPAQEGIYRDYPKDVHPALVKAFREKGFERLYTHQHSCWEAVRQGKNAVVVAYVGDGALANGATHETLNMASLWQLPLVIVRVDNQYAESTPASVYRGIPDVIRYVESYGVRAEAVEGNDVDAVAEAARRMIERTRDGGGPGFLQCATYRRYGHNAADVGAYRPPDEVEAWRLRDPLVQARAAAAAHGVSEAELDAIDSRVLERIERAIAWAEQLPEPPGEWAFEDLYADPATLAAFGGTVR